ncbi:MAG: type II toxin-antitoxin system Phd/YefM family antitoxin [Rhodoferax sp.]|nr:type II toxin-antitoxin system Phd/YefM family antitoxin [Rhodoferax sp.]
MQTWQLQEAKSRFGELVEMTLTQGPQMVTRHGSDAVVLLSALDYQQLTGATALRDLLLNAPRGEPLDIDRRAEAIRPVDL